MFGTQVSLAWVHRFVSTASFTCGRYWLYLLTNTITIRRVIFESGAAVGESECYPSRFPPVLEQ